MAMRHLGILGLVIFGLVSVSGPAAAVTIGKTVRDAVVAREASGCVRSGCVQPIQMWSMTPRAAVMPADQRQLLERLLSRRLSDFINSGERQILSAALARGERLSGDAVAELVTMLREREGMLAQQVAATQRAQQEEAQRQQAEADRRQQEVARAEAAERERLRQEELARAQAAEQERLRQEALARADPAAAERSRQEQELARAEAAEQERRRAEALARAKAEEAALAVAQEALARAKAEEQARLQQEEELAQAKAQEEALARAAAAEAARSFVFYEDLPPLRPL